MSVSRHPVSRLIEIEAPDGGARRVLFKLTDALARELSQAITDLRNLPIDPADIWYGARTKRFLLSSGTNSFLALDKDLPRSGLVLSTVGGAAARLVIASEQAQQLAGSLQLVADA